MGQKIHNIPHREFIATCEIEVQLDSVNNWEPSSEFPRVCPRWRSASSLSGIITECIFSSDSEMRNYMHRRKRNIFFYTFFSGNICYARGYALWKMKGYFVIIFFFLLTLCILVAWFIARISSIREPHKYIGDLFLCSISFFLLFFSFHYLLWNVPCVKTEMLKWSWGWENGNGFWNLSLEKKCEGKFMVNNGFISRFPFHSLFHFSLFKENFKWLLFT